MKYNSNLRFAMKKLLVVLIIICMVFSIAACDTKEGTSQGSDIHNDDVTNESTSAQNSEQVIQQLEQFDIKGLEQMLLSSVHADVAKYYNYLCNIPLSILYADANDTGITDTGISGFAISIAISQQTNGEEYDFDVGITPEDFDAITMKYFGRTVDSYNNRLIHQLDNGNVVATGWSEDAYDYLLHNKTINDDDSVTLVLYMVYNDLYMTAVEPEYATTRLKNIFGANFDENTRMIELTVFERYDNNGDFYTEIVSLNEYNIADFPYVLFGDTDDWQTFVAEMATLGINEENLETLSNSGYTDEEIMDMTAEIILEIIGGAVATTDDMHAQVANYIFNTAMLDVFGDLETGYDVDMTLVNNISELESLIENYKNGGSGDYWGYYIGSPMPVVYYIGLTHGTLTLNQYYPDGNSREHTVTNVYEHEIFYQLYCQAHGDERPTVLSIPMRDYGDNTTIGDYEIGSDMISSESGTEYITAKEAAELANKIHKDYHYYAAYHMENDIPYRIGDEFGTVVPIMHEIPIGYQPALPSYYMVGSVTGADSINDERYYRITFTDEQSGATMKNYLVNAASPNIIFEESLADGSLVPIAYGNL